MAAKRKRKIEECERQLASIEEKRRAVMAIAKAMSEYLVLATGKGWRLGIVEHGCADVLEACFKQLDEFRKVVRMVARGIDVKRLNAAIEGERKELKDLFMGFALKAVKEECRKGGAE